MVSFLMIATRSLIPPLLPEGEGLYFLLALGEGERSEGEADNSAFSLPDSGLRTFSGTT